MSYNVEYERADRQMNAVLQHVRAVWSLGPVDASVTQQLLLGARPATTVSLNDETACDVAYTAQMHDHPTAHWIRLHVDYILGGELLLQKLKFEPMIMATFPNLTKLTITTDVTHLEFVSTSFAGAPNLRHLHFAGCFKAAETAVSTCKQLRSLNLNLRYCSLCNATKRLSELVAAHPTMVAFVKSGGWAGDDADMTPMPNIKIASSEDLPDHPDCIKRFGLLFPNLRIDAHHSQHTHIGSHDSTAFLGDLFGYPNERFRTTQLQLDHNAQVWAVVVFALAFVHANRDHSLRDSGATSGLARVVREFFGDIKCFETADALRPLHFQGQSPTFWRDHEAGIDNACRKLYPRLGRFLNTKYARSVVG
jgi:hypothetical protein